MSKLFFYLYTVIILSNTCLGQQLLESFTVKYPPCSKELQLIVKPDTIIIYKDSLVNDYFINLDIRIINTSDSLINLNGIELDGINPDTIETGLYTFGKGISYQIFDRQDSAIIMESDLAEKVVEGDLEKYLYEIENELKYLDSIITKHEKSLANNEKYDSYVLLKPAEKYSFTIAIHLHTMIESKLSFAENYYRFEKSGVYYLIVYYSNEEYLFVEKNRLKHCAFSNPVTLIIN